MTRDEILGFCERRQRAMDDRDQQALAALHAEQGVLESPLGGAAIGPEGVAKVYGAFFSAFPDVVETISSQIIDGDRVVLVGTLSGTQLGAFMGLPPSGRAVRFPIVHVLTLRDHAIVHERRIYDFTGLLLQIGVLKAKPA